MIINVKNPTAEQQKGLLAEVRKAIDEGKPVGKIVKNYLVKEQRK